MAYELHNPVLQRNIYFWTDTHSMNDAGHGVLYNYNNYVCVCVCVRVPWSTIGIYGAHTYLFLPVGIDSVYVYILYMYNYCH